MGIESSGSEFGTSSLKCGVGEGVLRFGVWGLGLGSIGHRRVLRPPYHRLGSKLGSALLV